jgi:hypothetical protein
LPTWKAGQAMSDKYLNLLVGVALPGLQALITALAVGALGLSIALLLQYPKPWRVAFLCFALALLLSWLAYTGRWSAAAYYIEPGQVIETLPEQEPVTVLLASNDLHEGQYLDLPINREQLYRLASGLAEGMTLSESAWTGSGKPFTRGEFSTLRAEFIRRGLATWNNPTCPARGVSLTRPGQAMVRHLCDLPTLGAGWHDEG